MTQDSFPPPVALSAKRADALDALRGLAILAMVLSGTIRYQILPSWMYHAQTPPPTHQFNPAIAGLTWVDVVFPLFLFTMGAAIPLALSRRLADGKSIPQVILYILKRGLLLAAFAIILQQLRPTTISSNPVMSTWLVALLGFVLLFLTFGRWSTLTHNRQPYDMILNGIGWIGTIALLSQLSYNGEGFSLERSDPILMALANMVVFGSLAWVFTRSNPVLRLGLLAYLIALQFSASSEGWIKWLWGSSLVPWLFQFYYLKYLFIVIPGTLAGDWLLNWIQKTSVQPESNGGHPPIESVWSSRRIGLILVSMLLLCGVLLVGLQARWVWQTTGMAAILCIAIHFLFRQAANQTEYLLSRYYHWGVYWLFLGLCFEPFQKGIHKDPSTYSYYFVTVAIALFLLIVFTILREWLGQPLWLQLLMDNGQNPMIAYVAFANLLWPLLQITGLETVILAHTETPLMGVVKGVLYTASIALITSLFTRLKLFWRT